MWPYLTLLLIVFLLSGCGTQVHSKISVFHQLSDGNISKTYTVVQFRDQKESLEHQSYEQLVKAELDRQGWHEVAMDKAEVAVFLSYEIDSGKQVTSSLPVFGQTGVSSSSTYGTYSSYGGYGSYSGTTSYTPTYGVVGSRTVSQTLYTRSLQLDILDRKRLDQREVKKIYEAKVLSSGSSSQLVEVLPTMIKALFEEFPGKSGSIRTSKRRLE